METNQSGFVIGGDDDSTTVPNVYAIGDVILVKSIFRFYVKTTPFDNRYRPANVINISARWCWNTSCVILYLSDSTSRTIICTAFCLQ